MKGKLKITFLGSGTSQGVPVIACPCEICSSIDPKDNRLRSSVLVEQGDTAVVIDTGPDFRQQMLRAGVKNLSAVVFTHEHKDHIAGLDDVRAFNFIQEKAIDIFATERVQTALKREFYYAFEKDKYPGVPELNLHTIEDDISFQVDGLTFLPIKVWHYRMPVLGFRINGFTYITDAKSIDEEEKEKIKGSEVLVLNALRKESHISHFTLHEALELINELQPKKAYLTHISHLLGKHEEISAELPENVYLAYDGLTLELE